MIRAIITFMHQHLFDRVNIDPEQDQCSERTGSRMRRKNAGRYEELIRSLGGVDLQLLGLGHNGHIGFNEPGEAFEKETHCVDLTESTIEANQDDSSHLPTMCQNRHIRWESRHIMQAKKILDSSEWRKQRQIS